MPLAHLLLAQAVIAPDPLDAARLRTAAEPSCRISDAIDVTVCGRRNADRFRLPIATGTIGKRDDVVAERAALLHKTTPLEDMGPFLVGGGMVGVTMKRTFGVSGSETHLRPLAP